MEERSCILDVDGYHASVVQSASRASCMPSVRFQTARQLAWQTRATAKRASCWSDPSRNRPPSPFATSLTCLSDRFAARQNRACGPHFGSLPCVVRDFPSDRSALRHEVQVEAIESLADEHARTLAAATETSHRIARADCCAGLASRGSVHEKCWKACVDCRPWGGEALLGGGLMSPSLNGMAVGAKD